jgi:hypothetical protein
MHLPGDETLVFNNPEDVLRFIQRILDGERA